MSDRPLTQPTVDRLRIDRSRPASRGVPGWFVLVLVALAALVAAGVWWMRQPKPLQVTTVVAQQPVGGSGPRTVLNASGYITARRSATVSSKVTGKVVDVLVEEGMSVPEGQVVAHLDATNVEASLHLAEAQLVASQSMVEETRPNLEFAQREQKRFSELAKTRVVSDSDFRRAEMEAMQLEARLARQMAEVRVREREIAEWKQQVDDTIIRAPFSGVVTSKNAQPGEMISPMSVGGFTRTGICTIVDMSSLEIEVDVSESYIHRVQPNLAVEATLDAYPSWQVPAKVIAIIPTADRQKATVKVRVAFEKLDPRILPDMGVKVAFQASSSETGESASGAVTVPANAVQTADGQSNVWVVSSGKVERRAITAAPGAGGSMNVTAGLRNGERVITNPPPALAEGTRVAEKGS